MIDDQQIKTLLEGCQRIALVGASAKPHRDSYRVMAFLLDRGYQVIPVNPLLAGEEILGQRVVAELAEITGKIDLVDIFRNSEDAAEVVDQAIDCGASAVWFQLGVINESAAEKAHVAGLQVVLDRCPKIEIPRLGIQPTFRT